MSSSTVPLLDDDTIEFGDEDSRQPKSGVVHPYVTFFHLLFRIASVVVYLLCEIFSESFIASFVTIMLLLSMDFWTVKNITGRLMVGLRWWNCVDDDGKSHWVFESRKGLPQNRINEKEASIFWTALVLTNLLWFFFFIIAMFRVNLKWMLLIMIALVLNGANLYGYVKCKVGHKESLRSVTTNFLRNQVLQNAASIVVGQTTKPASNVASVLTNNV